MCDAYLKFFSLLHPELLTHNRPRSICGLLMRFVTLLIKNSNNLQVIRFLVSKRSSSSSGTFKFFRKHLIKLRYKILYNQKFIAKAIFTNVQNKKSLSKGKTKQYN